MRHFIAFAFLLLSLPAFAARTGNVRYVGGTAPEVKAGAVGQLDTTAANALIFEHSGNKLEIPYASIHTFEYSKEVARHLGVLPFIAVSLVKMRQHRHFFRISYRDQSGAPQVVIFEVPKHMPRTLQAILNARAPYGSNSSRPCGCGTGCGGW